MTLKYRGNERNRKNREDKCVTCSNCKREINLKKAKEDGYIDKYEGVKTCLCPFCGKIFKI